MRIKVGRGKDTKGEIGVGPDGVLTFAPTTPGDSVYLEQLAELSAELMVEAGADPSKATAEDVLQFMVKGAKPPDWARAVE